MKKKHKISAALTFISLCLIFAGCTKFVQIEPPVSSITGPVVYNDNSSASAVMTGIYANMISNPAMSSGNISLSFLEGLAADELKSYSSQSLYTQFYENALSSSSTGASNSFWQEIYKEIHVADALIEGLAGSTGVTTSMKQQLDGEAKFIRAFYNFYAVNIYGDVPLVLSTNYLLNNTIKRAPKAQVYMQIVKDLADAKAELSDDFVDASGNITSERIRPNKGAAAALLSRVYLYLGDWESAKEEADTVIGNTANYTLLTDLSQVFLKNSQEAIWQLPSIYPDINTWDAQYFILAYGPPDGKYYPAALSDIVINAFEPNDLRLTNWVSSFTSDSVTFYYYPYKYKDFNFGDPVTEYLMVFRLAEQYLIRAEAKTRLGSDISGAQADLNIVRTRAGLPNTTATDQGSLLNAILHERQVELFTEWGHRWFDLIRTGNINSVMGTPGNVCAAKGGTWNANDTLAPLPLSELQINSNLTQNPGY